MLFVRIQLNLNQECCLTDVGRNETQLSFPFKSPSLLPPARLHIKKDAKIKGPGKIE